jgi:hypothetical protein
LSEPTTAAGDLRVAAAGLPGVRGHAVLKTGLDEQSREAVAAWRLDAFGTAIGAWVVPLAGDDPDLPGIPDIYPGLRGCAVVDWAAGPLPKSFPPTPVLLLDDLLAEIREHRQRYTEAHDAFRATRKAKITELAWPSEVPAPEHARTVLGVHRGAASPAAAAALAVSGAVRQAIELWEDTEQVRYRRVHLRSFGDAKPLPPRWLAALREAATCTR